MEESSMNHLLVIIAINTAMVLFIWILCYLYLNIFDRLKNGEILGQIHLIALAIGMSLRFWQFVIYGECINDPLLPVPDILFGIFLVAAYKINIWTKKIFFI